MHNQYTPEMLRNKVKSVLIVTGLSWTRLEIEIGVPAGSLLRWTVNYHPSVQVLSAVAKWMDDYQAGNAFRKNKKPEVK